MKGLLIFLMLSFAMTTQAQDSDGERFVQGCNELIGIYKNKKEKRLLASQLVSSSDAMLAGYCMGVIKAFKQVANPRVIYERVQCADRVRGPCHQVKEVTWCQNDDWFEIAERVANYWNVEPINYSVSELLTDVCGA